MGVRHIDSRDERAVRALPRYLEEAWNRGDGLSYAALFTADCDYIGFDGTRLKGRAANARHHQRLFDSVLHGSKLQLDSVNVRFLTPDLALVHAGGSIFMPWQTADERSRGSLQTYVVARSDDGWRIEAFQSVKVRPLSVPRGLALRLLLAFIRFRTLLAALRLQPAGGW